MSRNWGKDVSSSGEEDEPAPGFTIFRDDE
jgi:hypothetical protein